MVGKMPAVRARNSFRCSKQMWKMIEKAEKAIQDEGSRQLDLVNCSCMLALYRYWGWRTERLSNLLELQEDIYAECGSDNDMSMIRLLDEECDIELTNHEGVSYRNVIFLNSDIDEGKPLTAAQWLAMRQNQKKWVEAQITACICLSLHRKEGWGFKRLRELMVHMQDIKEEFDYNPKLIVKAVKDEANYDWVADLEVKTNE